ncbi:hypothetical protein MPTK1_2g11830 [Marchantia polymorpha subsp. ruderalis]|uniref:Uncharacterized protein n=1 Tax=Marchantia polymorpha TaxID=3197 RepID=A0A2R6XCM3_MARPO|nr:hypothetical protein MARPO_0023s0148 [Marchantia polymorpha]BBN01991.1 hypothetical protein Mp_2g11830 [Marchantia polymorpha subsp. ruderalis]|eukprot:PTQ43853.1 hypothetical protein MARPO_0023s0148 [Marchantia polymorpha]
MECELEPLSSGVISPAAKLRQQCGLTEDDIDIDIRRRLLVYLAIQPADPRGFVTDTTATKRLLSSK